MLIRNKLFWGTTAIFLLVGFGLIWLAFPPLLGKLHDQRQTVASLDGQIAAQQQYVTTVKKLSSSQEQVDKLYNQAVTALPQQAQTELVILQLNGLLSALGLNNLAVTTPFSQASVAPSAPASTGGDAKAAGSAGGSVATPIVKSSAPQSFTLSGSVSFDQVKQLIVGLRGLARWNKLDGLTISEAGGTTTVSLTGEFFTKASAPKDFSGNDPNLLTKASNLFNSYKSYATSPDISTEGSFGRSDPFTPAK